MRWLTNSLLRLLVAHGMPLAALISLQTLQNLLSVIGYPAVALFIMIESAGIPFPGETMLLLASFFAATNHQLQIPFVIACAALGAIVGDNLGYLAGRTGGRALALRFGKYIFLKPEHLDYAEKFFAKHGDKTVFFGRFIAVLRAWAAFLAGINHMRWSKFLIFNAAGGIIWAIIYGTLGFLAGRVFHDNFTQVEHIASAISWIGAAVLVLIGIGLFILFRIRRKRHMLAAIKSEPEADAPGKEEQADQPSGSTEPEPGSAEPALTSPEPETPVASVPSAPDGVESVQK
ncbi:MAG TPA: VTT domain-containing protein [Ktedonobacteraceae bacterium]|nr:VTT domain-containing protein [Ktedonobacteraceae bacterium]